MTQEEKYLLLKDLCARLPYGAKVSCLGDFNHEWYNLELVDIEDNEVYITTYEPYANRYVKIEEVKPYLFPLSSMTDEQRFDFATVQAENCKGSYPTLLECSAIVNWGYKHHLDVNNLIPKGLAIDATGLNIY